MQTPPIQEPKPQGTQQHGYRGRVRSGCLTCRSRKVKCDEAKPICKNCTKVRRECVYKPRKVHQVPAPVLSPESTSQDESGAVSRSNRSSHPEPASHSPDPLQDGQQTLLEKIPQADGIADISLEAISDPFLFPDEPHIDVRMRLENALRRQNEMAVTADDPESDSALPSTLISRDIELTTTMDMLAVREPPLQPSFSFFVEEVDCPAFTPFDSVNWQQMKLHAVELGISNAAVASAIIAVSVLYKGLTYSLPLSKALSLYRASRVTFEKHLNDESQDFSSILVATFLLCLFEFTNYESVPFLKDPNELFIKRLRIWAQQIQSYSEHSLRILAWLRLLNVATSRGGGMGLISDDILCLFPDSQTGKLNLKPAFDRDSDASTNLYQMLSIPIFDFYFQLQMISGEICRLTHYHRSRTTGVDQKDVVQQIAQIRVRLQDLWETRSAIQRQTPDDLRSNFAPKIADPIIKLIGLCAAAHHAETVEIFRVLGDPVSESPDSIAAISWIQEIVDGDWNVYDGDKLNPGYLRPLFLVAIECMNREQNEWAVERLRQVRDPICRSDFFASFGKELSDAQLRKERRVTSRYFCIWYFGVPPPYL